MPTLAELASLLGGTVDGPATLEVTSIAAVDAAGPAALTFITDEKFLPLLASSGAGAVLLAPGVASGGKPAVRVADPRSVLPVLLKYFAPVRPGPAGPPVDPTARVHPAAKLAPGVRIGAYAVVEEGVTVGEGTEIGPLCVVAWGAAIGGDCRLMPLVSVGARCAVGNRVILHSGTVVGADGFGFLPGKGGPVKIPQIGRVVLEDDVEIGSNCTVDRATVGETVLRRGVKLDNLVHIAHNCVIGEGTMIAAGVGISGSVRIGRGCLIGGQAGVSDHVTIGNGVQIGGGSGVNRDLADGEVVFGYPARPAKEAFRLNAWLARIPKLLERIRDLEKRVQALDRKDAGGE